MVYLDNAATTKPCDEAVLAAENMMKITWHNPSSLYKQGMFAQDVIDASRESVAALLGCKGKNVIFTSGGTESNNLAVHSALIKGRHVGKKIVASAYEHSSIYENLLRLKSEGYEVEFIYPESDGSILPEKVAKAVDENTALVCIMLSNNEIGALNDLKTITKLVKEKNRRTLVHSDAVALFGKMPINAVSLGVDTMSVSAHKVHALKGCGALYVKDGVSISPLIFGGEQERRIRPGTENAVGIAAFGAACDKAKREMSVKFALAKECQKRIFEYENNLDFVTVNAKNELPFVTSVCVKGIRSETLLHFLESEGVLVSSGSACSHGKKSHVLVALGLESDVIDSTIRVSVAGNDVSDIDALFEAIIKAHNRLIKR